MPSESHPTAARGFALEPCSVAWARKRKSSVELALSQLYSRTRILGRRLFPRIATVLISLAAWPGMRLFVISTLLVSL